MTNRDSKPGDEVLRYTARSLICCDPPGDVVLASDYDALTAERDRLAKDAERYRWLRAEHGLFTPLAAVLWKYKMDRESSDWVNTASPESLDAAIDAALKEKHDE